MVYPRNWFLEHVLYCLSKLLEIRISKKTQFGIQFYQIGTFYKENS